MKELRKEVEKKQRECRRCRGWLHRNRVRFSSPRVTILENRRHSSVVLITLTHGRTTPRRGWHVVAARTPNNGHSTTPPRPHGLLKCKLTGVRLTKQSSETPSHGLISRSSDYSLCTLFTFRSEIPRNSGRRESLRTHTWRNRNIISYSS